MHFRGLLFLIAMTPVIAGAQQLVADPANSAAIFQSMQQQQAYMFEAQAAQAAQLARQQQIEIEAQQRGQLVTGLIGMCAQMFGGLQKTASDIQGAASIANGAAGPSGSDYYYPPGGAGFSKGCEHFTTKDGQLGKWGRAAEAEMENYAVFSNPNIDVSGICKNYSNLDPERRKKFWGWVLMSMASKESGCNEGVTAQGVNGATAVGLFQLNHNQCPPRNMRNGDANTQCAVKMLGEELSRRGKLASRCSRSADCAKEEKGQDEATYWAVLRVDGAPDDPKKGSPKSETVARQKEIGAGYASRQLMAQFPGCND